MSFPRGGPAPTADVRKEMVMAMGRHRWSILSRGILVSRLLPGHFSNRMQQPAQIVDGR
jgi:hypothetical protein